MSNYNEKTRDLAVLQLLTRLVRETDRIVRLADDIDNYAETPEAKAAFLHIGEEVQAILKRIETNISPLYSLYEKDSSLKSLTNPLEEKSRTISTNTTVTAEIISRQEKGQF